MVDLLTLSQMTNFRIFQTKTVCRQQFQSDKIGRKFSWRVENTVWKKKKLLVMGHFFFSHSIFKKLVPHTHKCQCFFGKRLMVCSNYIIYSRVSKSWKVNNPCIYITFLKIYFHFGLWSVNWICGLSLIPDFMSPICRLDLIKSLK